MEQAELERLYAALDVSLASLKHACVIARASNFETDCIELRDGLLALLTRIERYL